MRTILPSREFKQTLNLSYGGKRVAAYVREAAVNDDDMVAGRSRSYCYFVPLRRVYNDAYQVY